MHRAEDRSAGIADKYTKKEICKQFTFFFCSYSDVETTYRSEIAFRQFLRKCYCSFWDKKDNMRCRRAILFLIYFQFTDGDFPFYNHVYYGFQEDKPPLAVHPEYYTKKNTYICTT